jgi:very-short-patch-repair endonuclease
MYVRPEVHDHFARQHGIVSVRQLHDAGVTPRQIEVLERNGAIVMACRGAYRSPSVPFDELARCAAICLARPNVTISGPTAGRLWGFRRLPRDQRIHVIAPPASNPSIERWVCPYRTAAIHDVDVVVRDDGIRITSRARTAFDLARWLRHDDLLSVIEQAMRDGNVTETEMYDVAVDWLSPRRRWAREYVRQLDYRLPGRPAESHPEVRIGRALRRGGVHGVVRQYPIELPGYGSARFDLAVPRVRWALEVDVFPTHDETAGRRNDRRRDEAAQSMGWTVFRILRDDYERRFTAAIDAAIASYRTTVAMSQTTSGAGFAHR